MTSRAFMRTRYTLYDGMSNLKCALCTHVRPRWLKRNATWGGATRPFHGGEIADLSARRFPCHLNATRRARAAAERQFRWRTPGSYTWAVVSLGAGDKTDLAALVACEKPISDGTEDKWRQESKIGTGPREVICLAHDDP